MASDHPDISPEARAARARARRDWPVRRFELGHEPADDLLTTTTVEERIAMVWQVTLDAWASAGREIPDLPRSEWPSRVTTLDQLRAEESI